MHLPSSSRSEELWYRKVRRPHKNSLVHRGVSIQMRAIIPVLQLQDHPSSLLAS